MKKKPIPSIVDLWGKPQPLNLQLLQNRIPKRIINLAAKKKEKIQVLNEAHDKLTENQRADLQRQLKEIKRVIRAALKAYNKLECEEEKIREQLRSL